MKYRGKTDIQNGILEVTRNGATRTRLKYQANLTSRQIRDYIPRLQKEGLIQLDSDTKLYQITDKGLRWLGFVEFVSKALNQVTLQS